MAWWNIFAKGTAGPPKPPRDTSDDDDTNYIQRHCFVVMPFGLRFNAEELTKLALQGFKLDPEANITAIDFDQIYERLIEPAVEMADKELRQRIECVRADHVTQSGFIHKDMLERLALADVAIVDITTQNANVFYELGVRHCFRRSTTILIRREGTHIPFNIAGMRTFDYSDDSAVPEGQTESPLEQSKVALAKAIKHSFSHKENDSLVHNLMPNVSVQHSTYPILEQHWIERKVLNIRKKEIPEKRIGFITGDIMHIQDVDAWINPENTNMEMARIHDGSVSSLIRYYGAERDKCGRVTNDTIGNALRNVAGSTGVEPGAVIITGPGKLEKSNNVTALFHLAAMQGEPGYGYQPVRDYPGCLRRVLHNIDLFNSGIRGFEGSKRFPIRPAKRAKVASVLCPLFGSRAAQQQPHDIALNLFYAAVVFFQQNLDTELTDIYFLAYTEQDRLVCESAIGKLLQEGKIALAQGDKTG